MQIARSALILFLIALSGCTEKLEASDPPAIGLAGEPGIEIAADNAPMVEQARVAEVPAEPPSEPRMKSPVQYD
jgi:hypothetical protein